MMSKTLVLTEKPSVARDIARVLKCGAKAGGFIEGDDYIVTWALGHLVTLAEPEAYGERFRYWRLEDLPMLPEKMELAVIRQTKKQYSAVKSLLQRKDVSGLIIATDSGREGELVARWILQKAGFRRPSRRLWISSQTDRAVKDGFSRLRPSSEYDNLYLSAQCRAEADWLVGLNVTRALTCRYNVQLSAGRVQTPTLAMIVNREEELKKFVPKDYWTVHAGFKGISLVWMDRKTGQSNILDKDKAQGISLKVSGQPGRIADINKRERLEYPPPAYDLTELQRDANRRYGYSAKQTSNIMQALYEIHKAVTYPRTDSRYITRDMVPTLKERLRNLPSDYYGIAAGKILESGIHATNRLVDDSKVTDHHAIIPTEQAADFSALSREEACIYDLIARRFLAVLYPPCKIEETMLKVESAGELFTCRGRRVRDAGWKAVYGNALGTDEEDNEEDIQELPEMNKGDTAIIRDAKAIAKKTKPPSRFNEATLLSAMENPSKYMDDKELKKVMEKTTGLGTPATRADIIEKLFSSFYIEKKGRDIYPTSKGTQLIGIVPEDIKSPDLTARWEQELVSISRGESNPEEFIKEMKSYAHKLVKSIISSDKNYQHDNITREKCRCGKFLLEVNGKKGKMLVCPDRECGYRRMISQKSNARCPQCHKKLELKGDGENSIFFCNCGYREKLSDFKKRQDDKLSKRDISRFLKQQDKAESANTPFADALSKLKK